MKEEKKATRQSYGETLEKLGEKYNCTMLKGAGFNVDDLGCELAKKYGLEVLEEIAKINFKNTEKIKRKLGI